MAKTLTQTPLTQELRNRLERYEAESVRLRAELGDPSDAFDRLVRDMFEPEAIAQSVRNGQYVDDDDDIVRGGYRTLEDVDNRACSEARVSVN